VNQQWLSLSGNISGPGALSRIPTAPINGPEELCVNAGAVTSLDSFSAISIQAAIDRHLSAHPESRACLWPPMDAACRRRLHSLLGPLPDRCTLPHDYQAPKRDPRIVIPTLSVSDIDEAELIARTILVVAASAHLGNLRLAFVQAQVLATAAIAFLG
jgi:hypothetical protein